MRILVQRSSYPNFGSVSTIEVDESDTVLKVKEKIQGNLGIACEFQTLSIGSGAIKLDDDDHLLSSYDALRPYFDSTQPFLSTTRLGSPIISLEITRPPQAPHKESGTLVLNVKVNDEEELKLELASSATIKTVKETIEEETSIPESDQTLLIPLQDDTSVSNCGNTIILRTPTTPPRKDDADRTPPATANTLNDGNDNNVGGYVSLVILSAIIAPYVIVKEVSRGFLSSLWP